MNLSEKWRNHLEKDPGLNLHINYDKPSSVEFTHPGIPRWTYETFADIPDLITVIRICENCLNFGYHKLPGFAELFSQALGKGGNFLSFQTAVEATMSRAFYSHTVLKWPVRVRYCLKNRTGPFMTNETVLMSEDKREPLVTFTNGYVFVDKASRKTTYSLPEWMTSGFDKCSSDRDGIKIPRLKQRPSRTFCQEVKIVLLDLDIYNHANYVSYIKKCYTALFSAITEKETSTLPDKKKASEGYENQYHLSPSEPRDIPLFITSDTLRQGVKTLRVRYLKESLHGEKCYIHIWQEEDKPLWVFFVVEKLTNSVPEVVFEMSLEYFSPVSKM